MRPEHGCHHFLQSLDRGEKGCTMFSTGMCARVTGAILPGTSSSLKIRAIPTPGGAKVGKLERPGRFSVVQRRELSNHREGPPSAFAILGNESLSGRCRDRGDEPRRQRVRDRLPALVGPVSRVLLILKDISFKQRRRARWVPSRVPDS